MSRGHPVTGLGLHQSRRWFKHDGFFLPPVKLAARFTRRLKAWLREPAPEVVPESPAEGMAGEWVADVPAVGSGEAALKYRANSWRCPPLHESQFEMPDPC